VKPKLEYASHGPFVVEAQIKLNTLLPDAQPPLKLDGKYFDKTVARVKQFQKSRGLMPDGVVGTKTWDALDNLSPEIVETGPPLVSPADPHHDTLKKDQKAYFGARLHCSCGTNNSFLTVSTPGAAATAADCKAYVNIQPFGLCKSREHPGNTFEDTKLDVSFTVDDSRGNLRKWTSCTPDIRIPWDFGKLKDSDVINKSARCECRWMGTIRFV
jgi:hypothetical protein